MIKWTLVNVVLAVNKFSIFKQPIIISYPCLVFDYKHNYKLQKPMECYLQVRSELLPRVLDQSIGAASAVMPTLYQTVVRKMKLRQKAKFMIYVPTLTRGFGQ